MKTLADFNFKFRDNDGTVWPLDIVYDTSPEEVARRLQDPTDARFGCNLSSIRCYCMSNEPRPETYALYEILDYFYNVKRLRKTWQLDDLVVCCAPVPGCKNPEYEDIKISGKICRIYIA